MISCRHSRARSHRRQTLAFARTAAAWQNPFPRSDPVPSPLAAPRRRRLGTNPLIPSHTGLPVPDMQEVRPQAGAGGAPPPPVA